jgi:dTDP-4-dehydrorhamnose 3,5-epimerase
MRLDKTRIITPRRIEDERGSFIETYHKDRFDEEVEPVIFVQDNHSVSRTEGTVRGLHFQRPPAAQGKLVRVVRGAILDVAVDMRVGSPTFGRHQAEILTAENCRQFWIPAGFAHGFCTLEPDTEVVYKVTAFYSPAHDSGIAWDDPSLGIVWPVEHAKAVLSDKDRRWPRLADLPPIFHITDA